MGGAAVVLVLVEREVVGGGRGGRVGALQMDRVRTVVAWKKEDNIFL